MSAQIPLLSPAASPAAEGEASLRRAVAETLSGLRPAPAVTVVVNDPQRPTRWRTVLQQVRQGLSDTRLRALVATGTHRYRPDRRRRFEREALSAMRFDSIAWHDCDSPDLVDVAGQTPWRCHPWLLDGSWAVLAVGCCEPHYFAGITGAHKTVTIGCAAAADIQSNHAHALSPGARPGRLQGNPVHEGIAAMLEALTDRREVLAINLLQAGDGVFGASAGRPLHALESIAPLVRSTYIRRIQAPADALLLEVPGVLGRSFYQADKAIKNNEWAVRDGGCLVLSAACPDGIGQGHFMRLLRDCPSYESAETEVQRRGYRLGDHKAVKLRYLTHRRAVRVFAVSEGLTGEDLRLLGFSAAGSPEEALSAAGIVPGRDRVYRVAEAANTCVQAAS